MWVEPQLSCLIIILEISVEVKAKTVKIPIQENLCKNKAKKKDIREVYIETVKHQNTDPDNTSPRPLPNKKKDICIFRTKLSQIK